MTLTHEFARVAAERLVNAANRAPFTFDLSRHSQRTDGTWLYTYTAQIAGDRAVRRVEEDHLTFFGADGRELVRFAIDRNGVATVDCGGGPSGLPDWLRSKTTETVKRILGETSWKDLAFGGKVVFASDYHDTRPLFTESDGSVWHLLPSDARRDADRREMAHTLATAPNGDDFTDGGVLMSLVAGDGTRLATAWVNDSGSLGHRVFDDRTDPDAWAGISAVAVRLRLCRDDVTVPLPAGRTETVFGAGYVDGRERLHNLLGPAVFGEYVEYGPEHVVYAIDGRVLAAEEYVPAAVAAWVEEREGRPRPTDAADAGAWLQARVAAETVDLVAIAGSVTAEFEPLGTDFFRPTKPGGDANVLGRILMAATIENVEAVSALLRLHAAGNSPYGSGAEMAVAEGLLAPERADVSDMVELARDGRAPKDLAAAIAWLEAEELLPVCRPLLRARHGRGSWDAVVAAIPSFDTEARTP